MTLEETLAQLEALGSEKVRAQNAKHGARGEQFGVRLGDVRALAKQIKSDHELGLALWATANIDARLLAILLVKPRALASEELDRMVRSESFGQVADWLNAYVVKKHPDKESLREGWMRDGNPKAARSAWSLTADRVAKDPEGLDLSALLDRIEAELAGAAPEAQWTMNTCLVEIGIHFPELRERAVAIGEALGVYRDYPTSKGCTSPFAPIWIAAMVSRQG